MTIFARDNRVKDLVERLRDARLRLRQTIVLRDDAEELFGAAADMIEELEIEAELVRAFETQVGVPLGDRKPRSSKSSAAINARLAELRAELDSAKSAKAKKS